MTSGYPRSPKTVSGGIVLVDPDSARVVRVIVLQYNPETLSRTLQVQGAGAESGDRLDVLRLKGAPVETIKLEAEIDAADQLEQPTVFPKAVQLGIHPQLATLDQASHEGGAPHAVHLGRPAGAAGAHHRVVGDGGVVLT